MSENNILRDLQSPIILIIAITLIFFGLTFIFMGLASHQNVEGGGLIIIGPIPFFFYTNELTTPLLLFLPIIFIIIVFVTFILLFTGRKYIDVRRTD